MQKTAIMELAAKIEELVCEAMDIEVSGIINTNKSNYRTARKFIWYILVAEMDYNLSELAQRYGRTTRAVRYGISDVSFGLRTQRYYKEIYAEIAHLRAQKRGE